MGWTENCRNLCCGIGKIAFYCAGFWAIVLTVYLLFFGDGGIVQEKVD